MLILIDQDGPLANFELGFLKRWRERFPESSFVSVEQRRAFKVREDYPRDLTDRVESIYCEVGFYRSLPPVTGGRDALEAIVGEGHDVLICTAPLSRYENCVLEKYLWVEENLGPEFVERIVLTKDKTIIRGDVLVDDSPRVRGRIEPSWEHVIFDAPYNRRASGKRIASWHTWRNVLETRST